MVLGTEKEKIMSAFSELKRFVELCEEVAGEHKIPICVTVLDVHANPVLLHRMPGTGILPIEMADRKAYTSMSFFVETAAMLDDIQPGKPGYTLTSSSNRLIAFGGGTAVRFGDEVFGIGISGGPTAEEDIAILWQAQDRFGKTDAVWAERTHR
jgi:uncharacterized protein GlcG (DUF336 family)